MMFTLRTARAVRPGDRVQIPGSHISGTVRVIDTARNGGDVVLRTTKGESLLPDWADVWVRSLQAR